MIARGLVVYGMDIMTSCFEIVQGIIQQIVSIRNISGEIATVPQEIVDAVSDLGFFEGIPLWAITFIGGLFITVLSFIMILTVYGRFFKLYLYTAISPIPLSSFAGESTQSTALTFIKSYVGVCLEGAIIVLACVIFTAFSSAPPIIDSSSSPSTMLWSYIGELLFNMLILVGTIKMSDRVVKDMMGV